MSDYKMETTDIINISQHEIILPITIGINSNDNVCNIDNLGANIISEVSSSNISKKQKKKLLKKQHWDSIKGEKRSKFI